MQAQTEPIRLLSSASVYDLHDDVSDRVDEGAVLRGAVAVAEREQKAPSDANSSMVVEVKEGHLHRRLLLQDHPEGVKPEWVTEDNAS
eukprot:scaffold120205_cov35-Tisochrysis_lutea.AAC.3